MYELRFDGEQGSERFEIAIQSIIMAQKQIQVAEWDEVVSLLSKLKKIGKPTAVVGGRQLYDLQEGGGVVLLEKAEYKRLLEFVEQPIWVPHVLEQVMNTRGWLKDLKPVEIEAKKKPELVEG